MSGFLVIIWAIVGAFGVGAFLNELECFSFDDEKFYKNLKTVHPLTYLVVLGLGGPLVWYFTIAFSVVGLAVLLFRIIFKLGKRSKKD